MQASADLSWLEAVNRSLKTLAAVAVAGRRRIAFVCALLNRDLLSRYFVRRRGVVAVGVVLRQAGPESRSRSFLTNDLLRFSLNYAFLRARASRRIGVT